MRGRSKQKLLWPIEPECSRPPRAESSIPFAKPTVVFDTYWKFAAERQAAFFRRFHGAPYPWSNVGILQTYKFTNAYRASDRVSQYLIRNVIYRGPQSTFEVFFRTILFKLFNKIDTSHHSLPDGSPNQDNLLRDTRSDAVLIGEEFYCWGNSGPNIPKKYRNYDRYDVCAGRGHKCHFPAALVESFIAWLRSHGDHGYLAEPREW